MPIPGVVTEDAVRLGDDMPAFHVGEGGVLDPTRPDVFGIELGFKVLHLRFGERHHLVLTARVGLGLPSCAPATSPPRFSSASRDWRSSLGG